MTLISIQQLGSAADVFIILRETILRKYNKVCGKSDACWRNPAESRLSAVDWMKLTSWCHRCERSTTKLMTVVLGYTALEDFHEWIVTHEDAMTMEFSNWKW